MGNPFALKSSLSKLDQALSGAIAAIENEESRQGSAVNENKMLQKFQSWRAELLHLLAGQGGGKEAGTPQEGGMFTD